MIQQFTEPITNRVQSNVFELPRCGGERLLSQQEAIEERQKYVSAFNDTMIKIWKEQITLLGVARQECMDIMRELFRQFMSVLIQEKTRVEEEHIYLDPRISFQEIDRYFLSGCACAFFQVATDVYTDLRYNQDEWD